MPQSLLSALSTLLSAVLICSLYLVLRSFAVDEGDWLDRTATWAVSTMIYMAWFRAITRK
jgi:hypothetical protein